MYKIINKTVSSVDPRLFKPLWVIFKNKQNEKKKRIKYFQNKTDILFIKKKKKKTSPTSLWELIVIFTLKNCGQTSTLSGASVQT